MIDWHHLFGLTLKDYLSDSDYEVELEKSLVLQQQYLDIVIIKKSEGKPLQKTLDGLDNLSQHNLLTYKSLRELLNAWTINELISSYVIYRKQVTPFSDQLLPSESFRLYAVCTRSPQQLTSQLKKRQKSMIADLDIELATLNAISKQAIKAIVPGVYDISWGTNVVRLIVTSLVSRQEHNALWHLYSGVAENFVYGNSHYRWHYERGRQLLNQLYEMYSREEIVMPYTWEDFDRDYAKAHVHLLSPEERLDGLVASEVLSRFAASERLSGLKPAERLSGLTPQQIEDYLKQLKSKKDS